MTGLSTDGLSANETLPKPDTYPVLTLPSEIVSEIFIHFLPVYPMCPPPTGLSSPTLLTHICSVWREIALGTLALWRAFSWNFNNRGTDDEKMELLKLWLARSGSCPLSIEAEDYLPPGTLLDTLLPHRERLEYAKLRPSHFDPRIVHGGMTSLRRLHMRLEVEESLPVNFTGVPQLRSVSFEYRTEGTIIMLPWAQLTSLALHNVFPQECTPILQQAVNLMHCELAVEAGPGAFAAEPTVELLRLESLVLMGDVDSYCLDTFILPALRSFHVSGEELAPDPIAAITSLISKSGCKLQKLCIAGERTVPKHAYRNAFPTIPKLVFNKRWTKWEKEHDPRGDEEDSDSN
ncbi:hypothetical protein C8R43DRAFT_1021310 [Mycena crocata]|nr:hypothetical protein C8R43DRAFT_1021310 [Mycena crocata]